MLDMLFLTLAQLLNKVKCFITSTPTLLHWLDFSPVFPGRHFGPEQARAPGKQKIS